ncbi:MAG: c-type cytochrome [Candidatus Competibacteraceae bacterium]
MNQQDKSFLTTFTTIMAVLVMIAVAIFMISRLVAVLAAKPDDGSRRLASIEERIQKVGEVVEVGSAAPSGSDAATASPAPEQVAAAPSGEAVYTQACAACHAAGVLQAPKLGSKEQWEPRYAQGIDTLVHNAVNGIRAMPAKGGHPNLTEDDIRSTIVYMLKESGIEVAEAATQVAEAPPASAAEPVAAPTQEAAPAATTTAATQPAVAAVAETAPTAGKPQSVQEVTMAAAEAANAASQAAAAASQAAAAASQAAAAASQAAAAVSQAIDMLREMASTPATPEPKPTVSGPAKSEPAPAPSAPAAQPEPAAPAPEKAPEKATEIPRTLSGPPANAPKKPAPALEAKPSKPAPEEKAAPVVEQQAAAETAPEAAPPTEPAAAAQEQAATAPPSTESATPATVDITVPSDIHLARGKQLYSTACVICHQAGVAGAPKLGDKAAWAPRLTQGFDVLVEHSIKGYKGMPPKGGRLDIPDREIRSAVGYMLSELE